MEVAHVERHGRQLTACGTQLGAVYELRYRLEPQMLSLELVGERLSRSRSATRTSLISAGHLCLTPSRSSATDCCTLKRRATT